MNDTTNNETTSVSAINAIRANAYRLADKVTGNDRLNHVLIDVVKAGETLAVGPLNTMLALIAVVGEKGMAEFPLLGSEEDKSNNPENYSIPGKNDKGETISRPANFYTDYVERFDMVKATRERLEKIAEIRRNNEGDDVALGREADTLQGRITKTRTALRNAVGIWQQKAAIEALGLTVALATKKEADGTTVADGSTKPCTIIDMAQGKIKNLSVSSFLSLKPTDAAAAIAKGKDKYDAILATGNKRKPKPTGDAAADAAANAVTSLETFTTAFYNSASWLEEHESAIAAKLHRDLKGSNKDYDLLSAVFSMHAMLTPLVQSETLKRAHDHFLLNVVKDQDEAAIADRVAAKAAA